ncbi:MAG: helix-turn-helix transcriptional regulator [Clostridiaceae bacterium]|nr:helix-turn-helix transcriptional regulator [Clostridiaceae bacterium]
MQNIHKNYAKSPYDYLCYNILMFDRHVYTRYLNTVRRDIFLLNDDYFLWLATRDDLLSEPAVFVFPSQNRIYSPHDHVIYDIQIPTEGSFYLQTVQGRYLVETGSVLIVPPRIYHVAESIDNYTSPVRYTGFKLAVRRINSILPQLSPTSSSTSTVFSIYDHLEQPIVIKDDFLGLDTVRQLGRIMQEGQIGYYQKAQGTLLYLVTEIAVRLRKQLGEIPEPETSTMFDPFNYVDDLLRKERLEQHVIHYTTSNISLEKIANDLFLSPRQLSRIFMKLYGKSYKEFILDKRMQIAKFALSCLDEDFDSIAQICGYTHTPSWFRAFKKATGYTPGEYREKFSGKADRLLNPVT